MGPHSARPHLHRPRALDPRIVDELFRHAHTIKGEARTFELSELHRSAAELEEALAEARRASAGLDGGSRAALVTKVRERLVRTHDSFEQTRTMLVQASPIGEAVLDQASVFRSDLLELADEVAGLPADPRCDHIRQIVDRLAARPFGRTVRRLVDAVPTWAGAQGKRANLQVIGSEVLVPAALAERLGGVLTHLVRNAIAHGVEPLEERRAANKPDVGEIVARCEELTPGRVRITLQDDGQGLDEARLRARGAELGIEPMPVEELVFVPDVSTSQVVNELSGRGVGMQAVRQELREVDYDIAVKSVAGQGVCFVIDGREHG